jgi:hypothetical protein
MRTCPVSRNDVDLLEHARRYFRAAGECGDARKMMVLVRLGLEYLTLVPDAAKAARNRSSTATMQRRQQPSSLQNLD